MSNDSGYIAVEEQGDGYIRYSNGLQICFITVSIAANTTAYFPLPKPFIDAMYVLSLINHGGSKPSCFITYDSKTKTGFSITSINPSPLFVDVIGIGWWK